MSAATGPVHITAVRDRATRLYDRMYATWATSSAPPDGPLLDLPLHAPNERAVLADPARTAAWAASWRETDGVVWEQRRWASAGSQHVPVRVTLSRPAQVARLAGRAEHWTRLSARTSELAASWGDAARPVLRRHARTLADLDEIDLARLRAVVEWLSVHPDSGAYLRQLPVEGTSTKWAESHRGLLVAAVTAITGRPDLGLREAPGLVRARFLDPALAPAGMRDVSAAPAELGRLSLQPTRVLVVENLQTLLALEDEQGAVALHGAGYAVDRLAQIDWVRDARIDYWGDLDRDGFAILDRLRAHCPHVRSILMDAETLLSHRHLWIPDPTTGSAQPTRLTDEERSVVTLLRDHGDVRLEQERLAWPWCVERLRRRTDGNDEAPRYTN